MQEHHAGNRAVFGADESARLRRMIGRLARAMNPSASTEDLTPTQASVLGVVVARGRVRASALAAVEGLNPTMLSRVLGKLEGLGLLRRVPDETDQRAVVAIATQAGRDKSDRIRESRVADLLAVVDGLPPATAAALATALPALEEFTDALSRATGQNPPRLRRPEP